MSASIRYACLFLTAATAAGLAHADDAASRETVLKQVDVRETAKSPLNLNRESTAGSRLNLTSMQTPASVDVIPSETIRNRGQNTISEAVTQNAVGFTNTTAPIYGSGYAARGFSDSRSIMQLYDGTRLYVGIGNITFPFDTWTVDRIDVLHGPASVLYGEGAIGGVVNVVPKRPLSDAIHNEVQLSAGSYDSYGIALDSTGPLADDWSYRVAGSSRKSQGWVDLGESSSDALTGSLQWRPTDDLTFTLATDYGDQQPMAYFGTPLINGRLEESLRDENYNVKDHKNRFKDSWNQFKTEWTPNDQLELRNTVYLLHSNREWRNAEWYTWVADTNLIQRDDYGHLIQSQNQLGDRFDATLKSRLFDLDNSLVVGFDANKADFSYATRFSSPDPESFVPLEDFDHGYFNSPLARKRYSSEVSQYSLFAEDRLALSAQWTAIAGLRYDHIGVERDDRINASQNIDTTFETASWRLGTVYNPTENTAIYAQFSTASDPVASLLTVNASAEQFDLATGKQWEIGFKQSFAEGLGEWTVAVFDIEKKKLLVSNSTDAMQTDQIGKQSSTGIELALAMDLGGGVTIDTNATWLKAEYDDYSSADWNTYPPLSVSYDGKQVAYVPEVSANGWLGWEFLPRWNARVGVQYVGKAYQNEANTLQRDGYTVTHASLSWQPVDSTTLALQVHNVFDRVYAETWHNSGNQWFLGQPRTAEVSARMKF